MKIFVNDTSMLSVTDVRSICTSKRERDAAIYETTHEPVPMNPNYGVVQRVFMGTWRWLFGAPTKKSSRLVKPATEWWEMKMTFVDEQNIVTAWTWSHPDILVLQKTFKAIKEQLPDVLAKKVNDIMFEEPK